MTITIIAICAGVGVAALIAGVALLIRNPEMDTVEDRLETLAGMARRPGAVPTDASVLSSPLDDVPGMIEAGLLRVFNLRLSLEQANIEMSPLKFLGICAGLAGVGAAVVVVSPLSAIFALPIAATLGMLPMGWLWMAKRRRLKSFARQLPDALELMARGLAPATVWPPDFSWWATR